MVCRWCGGPWTVMAYADLKTAHACMRCDTDEQGHGWGPPRFVAIWDSRRAQTRGPIVDLLIIDDQLNYGDERGSE